MNPKDRVALITGGARIGQAVAKALVDRGAHLALVFRHSERSAKASAAYAQSKGRKSLTLKADLTFDGDLADIIPKVRAKFGRLDILVNMASTFDRTPLKFAGLKVLDGSLESNLRHIYGLSREAAPLMRKKGGGRIINFSDWTAASGRPRYREYAPYYAAKSGVIGLTQALALELAPDILVNAIAPGPIMPPAGISKKESAEVVRATPLARWGQAEEVAKAVLFLIETEFVTGECIRVDGGRHLF